MLRIRFNVVPCDHHRVQECSVVMQVYVIIFCGGLKLLCWLHFLTNFTWLYGPKVENIIFFFVFFLALIYGNSQLIFW